jgi:hypothetical protein
MIFAPAQPRIVTPSRRLVLPSRCPRCGTWRVRRPVSRSPLRWMPRWRGGVPAFVPTRSPMLNMANGDVLLDEFGNRLLDHDGNVLLDNGTADPCSCCGSDGVTGLQVLLCADDSDTGLIYTGDATLPLYFRAGDVCMYVPADAPTVTGTEVVPEIVYTSCENCATEDGCCTVQNCAASVCISNAARVLVNVTVNMSPPTDHCDDTHTDSLLLPFHIVIGGVRRCSSWLGWRDTPRGQEQISAGFRCTVSGIVWDLSGNWFHGCDSGQQTTWSTSGNTVDQTTWQDTGGTSTAGAQTVTWSAQLLFNYCCYDGVSCHTSSLPSNPDGSCPTEPVPFAARRAGTKARPCVNCGSSSITKQPAVEFPVA